MHGYTEIRLAELSPYANSFRETLQAVCESPAFRTSPKSCEFLRHVVHRALDGDTDELKERLIGMSLLGREATYDTGSDAGVRVRANDVRKRLTAYNKTETATASFTFDLPSGSYIPRFFRQATLPLNIEVEDARPSDRSEPYDVQVPLGLQQLATPTVIALFLCIVCLRWQIAREHPFTTFWQSVFQRHTVTLYLPPAPNGTGLQMVAMKEIQATAPLLNLAGQFSSELSLTGNATARKGDTLIAIGPVFDSKADTKAVQSSADYVALPDKGRFEVIDTGAGRRIFDRIASKMYPTAGSAALLTISSDGVRSIRIDGTDEASIDSLIELLCARDTFPEGLADDLSGTAMTQVIFPMDPRAPRVYFHDSSVSTQIETGKTQ
jgi:hypothetical protein